VSVGFPGPLRKAPPPAPPHVFIAYHYQDQDFAHMLAPALRRDRVSPFTEVGEMAAGDSLVRRLSSTMRPVDCLVPIISVSSASHSWVERDLIEIINREINKRRILVVPAKVDNCVLPPCLRGGFVGDFHGLGWNQAYQGIKAAILHQALPVPHGLPVVKRPRPVPKPPAPPPTPTATKQIYLSYDHENDGYYKDVLVTWSKMPGFAHFRVIDRPPGVPEDSYEAESIKQTLAKSIGAASGLLCVVGEKCAANRWMEWEVKKADELGKRTIAVRANRKCEVPEMLSDIGATCALTFTFEGIRRAMEEAYGESALD
jgi:hypothetical protein